jgi:hypothetical protein
MPYDFGKQILNAIALQDELGVKKDEQKIQRMQFNQQMAVQNRQFAFNVQKDAETRQYQQETLGLKKTETAIKEQEFGLKNYTPYGSLTPELQKVVGKHDDNALIPNNVLGLQERELTREETKRHNKQDEGARWASVNKSSDDVKKGKLGDIIGNLEGNLAAYRNNLTDQENAPKYYGYAHGFAKELMNTHPTLIKAYNDIMIKGKSRDEVKKTYNLNDDEMRYIKLAQTPDMKDWNDK